MKTVVAFSNTEGGVIYIGIDDDGCIAGVEDVDATSLEVVHLLTDTIRPDVSSTVNIEQIIMDGKDVIKTTVQEGPSKPYYLRDKGLRSEGVYIRKGPSSIQASESAIQKMIKESSTPFESMVAHNQNLTFETAGRIFKDSGVEFGKNQMISMGFFNGDLYTNLAYLVSDQCPAKIKFASYTNVFKTEFLSRKKIGGSILSQLEEAMSYIEPYNLVQSKIEKMKRVDSRPYPEYVLRESLINAIVHRDYSSSADTLISVFRDNITITSY